jgi:hypothetical protein
MSQTTTERGPCTLIWEDGSEWAMEREFTRVDDWRKTPWGPVNFGYVVMGPSRWTQIKESRA